MNRILFILIFLLSACTTKPIEVDDDMAILQEFITNSFSTLDTLLLDKNKNDMIEPMELGEQIWDNNGRITLLNCDSIGLSGEIPESIGNLTGLTQLGLKSNRLSGKIPESIGNLINLTQLSLADNSLSDSIPITIGNLQSLTRLDLSNNQLIGSIPKSIGKLPVLHTFFADLNNMSGSIPDDICTIYPNFIDYDLSNNKFCPPLPDCIDSPNLIGTQDCEDCGVGNKKIEGHCYSISDLTALGVLSNNSSTISDSLKLGKQEWHSQRLKLLDCYLQEENICNLSGEMLDIIGNLSALKYLDIANNQLSGNIPASIGNLTELTNMELQNNQLEGVIPPQIGDLINLTNLNIENNQLSGNIPASIGNLTELTNMELQNNQLEGVIPSEIGDLINLTNLNISENQLEGSIPDKMCTIYPNSPVIDVSNNQFCPPLPECIDTPDSLGYQECVDCGDELTQLNGYCYSQTDLDVLQIFIDIDTSGVIDPLELGIQKWENGRIIYLDLSDNGLSGEIPDSILYLVNLETLKLHSNQFISVSDSICNLTNLTWSLDDVEDIDSNIKNNKLCPPYPECIEPYVGVQDTTCQTN